MFSFDDVIMVHPISVHTVSVYDSRIPCNVTHETAGRSGDCLVTSTGQCSCYWYSNDSNITPNAYIRLVLRYTVLKNPNKPLGITQLIVEDLELIWLQCHIVCAKIKVVEPYKAIQRTN